MKKLTTEELLRELAFIRKQIAELEKRAEIAQDLIEATPYADELRHVSKEIVKLGAQRRKTEGEVRRRAVEHFAKTGSVDFASGVIVETSTQRWAQIDSDLSQYLDDGPRLMSKEQLAKLEKQADKWKRPDSKTAMDSGAI